MSKIYFEQLEQFKSSVSGLVHDEIYPHALECFFESINDWSKFHTLAEVKHWFENKRKSSTLEVTDIPMKDVKGWSVDEETGNITHTNKPNAAGYFRQLEPSAWRKKAAFL